MKYKRLGGAGVKVSELCLGGMTFGEADDKSFMHKLGSDEQTASRVMSRALELGVNFIDTADVYGQDGLSERVIGNWFEREQHRTCTDAADREDARHHHPAAPAAAVRGRLVDAPPTHRCDDGGVARELDVDVRGGDLAGEEPRECAQALLGGGGLERALTPESQVPPKLAARPNPTKALLARRP